MSTVEHPRRRPRLPGRGSSVGDSSADLEVVVVHGPLLYWPDCRHALHEDAVLYDRPVCDTCESV